MIYGVLVGRRIALPLNDEVEIQYFDVDMGTVLGFRFSIGRRETVPWVHFVLGVAKDIEAAAEVWDTVREYARERGTILGPGQAWVEGAGYC